MSLERIGIYGAGNVGSTLVMELARSETPVAENIEIASRQPGVAQAAILDAASAYPEYADRFSASGNLEGSYDVVVIAAGEQPKPDMSADTLLERNLSIAKSALTGVKCSVAVVIGTPVDRLTEELSKVDSFRAAQYIGFGGELDRARMRFVQHQLGYPDWQIYAIGEHGPRAIPYCSLDVEKYAVVKNEASAVLKKIKEATGTARNLATGVLLGQLLMVLSGETEPTDMCVSVPHAAYNGLSLTWPYIIGLLNIARPLILDLKGPAQRDFRQLVAERRFIAESRRNLP